MNVTNAIWYKINENNLYSVSIFHKDNTIFHKDLVITLQNITSLSKMRDGKRAPIYSIYNLF